MQQIVEEAQKISHRRSQKDVMQRGQAETDASNVRSVRFVKL